VRVAAGLLILAIAAAGCAAPASIPPPVGGGAARRDRQEAGAGAFLGSGACRGCHEGQYARWLDTGHARPFASLDPADRQRSACLRCHVTGFGDPTGYRPGGGPDLSNVGCESCHGPGADHARSAHPAYVPTLTGGECPPCETNRICRLCHTPERSPGFDLGRGLSRVGCKP
jgi:hypothetical protein